MLHSGQNMLRSSARSAGTAMRDLLAAHGRHADFRFDLGHGKGKKSCQQCLKT
ncbi:MULTISPECIES: hypothetical protein [unclassified Mesorhizobium]|uniref:hypothetical protein n=1 Tax=unclassified Mesorhizobium TaxID=325217 RepID=UPI00142F1ADF|nr:MULTISPECIES: hypothetical protein [unclassified Mesorhizobium]